ncbi:MAG: ABC transporter permease [Acidobacteria bacterium]|nr:ABC transporter permease [Acidobacteriota bacterium]
MNKLVLGNVLHRPLRTIITMMAVGIEVVMILSIVGVMIGMLNNARAEKTGIGADIIVEPPNASFIAGIGGAPAPMAVADVLAKLPHVAVASPVTTNLSTIGAVENIWGIDFKSYNALRPFVFLSGGPFKGPNDVIIDDIFAKTGGGHKVGQTIPVEGHPFTICGIVEHGKGGRKFIPIETLDKLLGTPGNASLFYIRSDHPKNEDLIKQEIKNTPGLEQYKVQTIQQWLSLMTPENLPGFKPALNTVIGIALIVGFLVIFQSMYTAVLERTREIGILKSLGASKLYIVNVILREAAMIACAGIAVGMILTAIAGALLWHFNPTFSFKVPTQWWFIGAAIALVSAILGALYPALKAAAKDPIDALAYE